MNKTILAVLLLLSGCTMNRYKINTVYQDPAEQTTISSEVEGKATIGRVAVIYERVLRIVNTEYIGRKLK